MRMRPEGETKDLCSNHLLTVVKIIILSPLSVKNLRRSIKASVSFQVSVYFFPNSLQHKLCFRICFISTGFFSFRQLSLMSSFYLSVFPYYLQLEAIFYSSSNHTHMERASLALEVCVNLKDNSSTHQLTHNMCKSWCCLG